MIHSVHQRNTIRKLVFDRFLSPTTRTKNLLSTETREAGLTGRVLYIDLDTVISGRLDDIAAYSGPFAALSVAGMSNECRSAGINSSIMSWDAAEDGQSMTVGAIYELLHDMYTTVSDDHIAFISVFMWYVGSKGVSPPVNRREARL